MDWVDIFPRWSPLSFLVGRSVSPSSRLPQPEIDTLKVVLVTNTLWLATAAATKASLLLFYYRVFSPSERFRLAVRIGAGIIFAQWLSLTCVTIFECRPIAASWDRTIIKDPRCIDLGTFTIASGIFNFLTDALILCLPIRMVWGLNTTKAQKITLTGVFLLGIMYVM